MYDIMRGRNPALVRNLMNIQEIYVSLILVKIQKVFILSLVRKFNKKTTGLCHSYNAIFVCAIMGLVHEL